ncbi:hypothetical protein Ancab_023838 [Ancistrocladus abbreviatus]
MFFRIIWQDRLHQQLRNNGVPRPSLSLLQFFPLRSVSSSPSSSNSTLQPLLNSLSLSQEAASTILKEIDLKNHHLDRPPIVLNILHSYGFSKSQLTSIFTRHPSLLTANPEKTLKPKLHFLSNNGISGHNLTALIALDPSVLRRSLKKRLIPCISVLNSFFADGDTTAASVICGKRGTWVLHKFTESMKPNLDTLRASGVPDSSILKMLAMRPRTLSRDVDEFSEIVGEIREMGFDPNSMMFIHGICVLAAMKKSKWDSKVAAFKCFGWTDEQVKALFVKQPRIMNSTVERIQLVLEFFKEQFGWTVDEFGKYPLVLFLSLKRRIIPRGFIVKNLILRGLIKKTRVGNAFVVSDERFLNEYLLRNIGEFPEILDMYQSKMAMSCLVD